MGNWDWDSIWQGWRYARLGFVLLAALGAWARHSQSNDHDPRMEAAVLQAFSEEASFSMPPDYQIERVPSGRTAYAVRPDGRRFPARTVRVGGLANRLYANIRAAGAEDPGPAVGVQEAMEALRGAYGRDLGPNDLLAIVPPDWRIDMTP